MLLRMERHFAVREGVYEDDEPPEQYDEFGDPMTLEPSRFYALLPSVAYPPSTIASESVLLPSEETMIESVTRLEAALEGSFGFVDLSEYQKQELNQLRAVAKSVEQTGPRKTQKRLVVVKAIKDAGGLGRGCRSNRSNRSRRELGNFFGRGGWRGIRVHLPPFAIDLA